MKPNIGAFGDRDVGFYRPTDANRGPVRAGLARESRRRRLSRLRCDSSISHAGTRTWRRVSLAGKLAQGGEALCERAWRAKVASAAVPVSAG